MAHDPRVLAVELTPKDLGHKITRHGWTTTDTFSKAFAINSNDKNWGLYRTLSQNNTPNWGSGNNSISSSNARSEMTGKNVDVVILDAAIPYPTTLEFAKNSDGTGFSRTVLFDWYQWHDVIITDVPYWYKNTPGFLNIANDHNSHTSGTVAGNSQGWARDSDIYNLNFSYDTIQMIIDWHTLYKQVNPITGVKNPTVTNNSWGYSASPSLNSISSINYRGTTYTPTSGSSAGSYVWDLTLLASLKIPSNVIEGHGFPVHDAGTDAAFIDAAKAGIINVASAGNSFFYIDVPGGPDYNNWFYYGSPGSGTVYYYNRGGSPGSAVDSATNLRDYSPICVGSYGAVVTGQVSYDTVYKVYGIPGHTTSTGLLATDYKSEFSNYGPGVDTFAPGEAIASVITSTNYLNGGVNSKVIDPRMSSLSSAGYKTDNTNNVFARDAGTSMAGPQVAGVIASMLEKSPRMTMTQVRQWISAASIANLQSTNGDANDGTNSGGAAKILYFPQTRFMPADIGGYRPAPWPPVSTNSRSSNGSVWPRIPTLSARNNQSTLNLTVNKTTIDTRGADTSACSMFIDGNGGQEITIPASSYIEISNAAGLFGTGKWTAELWLKLYALPFIYSTQAIIFIKGTYSSPELDVRLSIDNNGIFTFIMKYNNGSGTIQSGPVTNVGIDSWHHFAIVSGSSGITFYWDGSALGSPMPMTGWTDTFNYLLIGRGFDVYPLNNTPGSQLINGIAENGLTGFVSNLRITKGVDVYTGNFTLPNVPLQTTQSASVNINAISGTQCTLLTLQSPPNSSLYIPDLSSVSHIVTPRSVTASGTNYQNAIFSSDVEPSLTTFISPFSNTGNHTATITLTTTNVPDGTQVPYIISGRPQSNALQKDYDFMYIHINSEPLTGFLTINSGQATKVLTFTTTDHMYVTFRIGVYGGPSITFTVN